MALYQSSNWTQEEKESFDRALQTPNVEWGDWMAISKMIASRSNNQVKSFARNYERRNPEKAKLMKEGKRAKKLAKLQSSTKACNKTKMKKSDAASKKKASKQVASNVADPTSTAPQVVNEYFAEQGQLREAPAKVPFLPIHVPRREDVTQEALVSPDLCVDVLAVEEAVEEAQGARASLSFAVPFMDTVGSPYAAADTNPEDDVNRDGFDELLNRMAPIPLADSNSVSLDLVRPNYDLYRDLLGNIGNALRVQFQQLIHQHEDQGWWKGDMSSISLHFFGQTKSALVARNEFLVESLIALLVVMYKTTEWRTIRPNNFTEIDEITSLVYKARDLWKRVRMSLSRAGFSLLGETGWTRVACIDELVQALKNFGETVSNQLVENGNHNVAV